MSRQFEVKAVHGEPRAWEGHGKNFLSYNVDFEPLGGGAVEMNVEWAQVDTTPAPTAGQKVAGDISEGNFGPKFKKDNEATKEMGGGAPQQFSSSSEATASNTAKTEVDWDAKEARITRQAILKVVAPTINEVRSLTPEIKAVVEDIEQFVAEAPKRPLGQGASQGAVPATSSPQVSPPLGAAPGSPPVDLSGARTEEPQPKISLNFDRSEIPTTNRDEVLKLLDYAGLAHAPAREKVADYITGPLLVEGRSDAALSALQDLDRQGNALAQLVKGTETWVGNKLPSAPVAEDDIPF